MSKAQGLFIENQLAKKLGKMSSCREGDHVMLHVSGERVSKLKNILFSVRVTSCVENVEKVDFVHLVTLEVEKGMYACYFVK